MQPRRDSDGAAEARLTEGRAGSVAKRKVREADVQRHWQEAEFRDAKTRERMDRLIAGMTPENAVLVARLRKEKERLCEKPNSIAAYVSLAATLEAFTNGKALVDLQPDDLENYLDMRSAKVAGETVHQDATLVRFLVKFAHDSEDLPRGFRRATRFGKPSKLSKRRPVPDQDFALLMELYEDSLFWQSVWSNLREVGWRIEEMCSLTVGSVRWVENYGVNLELPLEKVARFKLKTGPRACDAVTCAPLLRVWLDEHPFRHQPEAPLYVVRGNQHPGAPWYPLGPSRVRKELQKACKYLEVDAITPHLFRHSSATDKARLGWNSVQANAYFGWAPGSKVWERYYAHIADEHLREQIRRDAGIDKHGNRVAVAATKEQMQDMFFDMMREAMTRRQ